jgi:predicted SnoaL-like aldol condensation-catalyzing enzyme
MNHSIEEKNKALVIEAFEAAFNRRDPVAFDRYWSPNYLQHSAHIPPGRDGLRNLIASLPSTLKYEHGPATAAAEYVMVHGRFSGFQDRAWVVVDIVRVVDGILVEHWDVIQDEATRAESKSGLPMFGDSFAS